MLKKSPNNKIQTGRIHFGSVRTSRIIAKALRAVSFNRHASLEINACIRKSNRLFKFA